MPARDAVIRAFGLPGAVPRAAIAILPGILLALGNSPWDLPWFGLAAIPALVLLLDGARSARAAALAGWAAGTGYFGLTLSWIVEPFQVDAARHAWMAPFAATFMAAGLALFWALAFWLAHRLCRGLPARALGLALALALTGYLRTHVFTGFPWALPAYAWVETPVAQGAAWFGPHGLGLLVLCCLALPAILRPLPVAAGLSGFAVLWFAGVQRLPEGAAAPAGPQAVIRLVQPNAPQDQKWQPGRMQEFYLRMIRATAAGGPVRPAAIVWPETAVPFLLGDRPDLMADIADAAGGVPVILGIRRWTEGEGWFNSMAAIGAGGEVQAVYDKHHLVPFGEYIPLGRQAEALGLPFSAGLAGGFRPGPGPSVLRIDGLPDFQPLICYEAIFPDEILSDEPRPGWLLQITNDAWFGTVSGPYQHLAQARFRAIEQGLPLARSANTGVSAMIDPYGRISASLALGAQGHVDAVLPAALPGTVYSVWGDLVFGLVALAVGAAVAFAGRTRFRSG